VDGLPLAKGAYRVAVADLVLSKVFPDHHLKHRLGGWILNLAERGHHLAFHGLRAIQLLSHTPAHGGRHH
jgi:hypothetical protein